MGDKIFIGCVGKTTLVHETAKFLGYPIENVEGKNDIKAKEDRSIGLYDNTEYWIGDDEDLNRDETKAGRLLGLLKGILKPEFRLLSHAQQKIIFPKDYCPDLMFVCVHGTINIDFIKEIIFMDFPDRERRINIMKYYLGLQTSNINIERGNELCIKAAANTFGFLPCDIQTLCNYIKKELHRVSDNWDEIKEDFFSHPRSFVRGSALPSYSVESVPAVHWDDIGGLDSIKRELQENIVWVYRHSDAFQRLGIEPVKGIMLYGPPGTGKTLLAKAIATEVNANFINTRISNILNSYVGESERILSNIFERARNAAPSVIFFDEIDALFGQRDSEGSQNCQMIVSQLLLELDNISITHPVMVIAATNCPEVIDSSFTQGGRFDQLIYVSPPDYWGRKGILDIFLARMPISDDFEIDNILRQTEGYTGADLRCLCNLAGQSAIARNMLTTTVSAFDFETAIRNMIPSVSKDSLQKYKSYLVDRS